MYKTVELYREPREMILPKLDLPKDEPEMTEFDSGFLCGVLKKFKPQKIVEVGVAAGGTTAVILQCMAMLNVDCEVHSIDLLREYYRDKSHSSGYLGELAKQYIPNTRHKLYLGKIVPECIKEIGGGIDCLILDTVHALPGELLDFLCLFPYLTEDAVVILHDLTNNYCNKDKTKYREYAYGTKILFDSIMGGDKYLSYDESSMDKRGFPNIGAFQLAPETKNSIANCISALSVTWYYFPEKYQMELYDQCIKENYDEECIWLFEAATKINKDICHAAMKKPKWSEKIIKTLIYLLKGYFPY